MALEPKNRILKRLASFETTTSQDEEFARTTVRKIGKLPDRTSLIYPETHLLCATHLLASARERKWLSDQLMDALVKIDDLKGELGVKR